MLVEKLLEQGERQKVVSYLAACQIVWAQQKEQIGAWIRELEAGGTPKFLLSGFMVRNNSPAVKLRLLTFRADSLGDELSTTSLEGDQGSVGSKGLQKIDAETLSAIRGKLESGKS